MQQLVITRPRININTTIYDMRQSGATLQQIADKTGRTKERMRQILVQNYGSTKHQLISTEQLCKLLDLPRNRIIELHQDGIIIPKAQWDTGNHLYLLWSPATVEQIISYYKMHRLCKICYHPIPKGRWVYCSEECYEEGQKYRYKGIEAKQRHIRSIKRYRERRKQLVQATVRGNSKYLPEPLVVSEVAMKTKETTLLLTGGST